jgi:hypothetical protein
VFPKIVNFLFWLLFWCEWLCSQKNLALRKSHVLFALRIMGFPQEFRTVRFNLEPKRCKSISLSTKRSVFTLVGLAHGVVTEKLVFRIKILRNGLVYPSAAATSRTERPPIADTRIMIVIRPFRIYLVFFWTRPFLMSGFWVSFWIGLTGSILQNTDRSAFRKEQIEPDLYFKFPTYDTDLFGG